MHAWLQRQHHLQSQDCLQRFHRHRLLCHHRLQRLQRQHRLKRFRRLHHLLSASSCLDTTSAALHSSSTKSATSISSNRSSASSSVYNSYYIYNIANVYYKFDSYSIFNVYYIYRHCLPSLLPTSARYTKSTKSAMATTQIHNFFHHKNLCAFSMSVIRESNRLQERI